MVVRTLLEDSAASVTASASRPPTFLPIGNFRILEAAFPVMGIFHLESGVDAASINDWLPAAGTDLHGVDFTVVALVL